MVSTLFSRVLYSSETPTAQRSTWSFRHRGKK